MLNVRISRKKAHIHNKLIGGEVLEGSSTVTAGRKRLFPAGLDVPRKISYKITSPIQMTRITIRSRNIQLNER